MFSYIHSLKVCRATLQTNKAFVRRKLDDSQASSIQKTKTEKKKLRERERKIFQFFYNLGVLLWAHSLCKQDICSEEFC